MDGLYLEPAMNGRAYFDDMSYFWVMMLGVRRKSLVMLCMTTVRTVEAAYKSFRR